MTHPPASMGTTELGAALPKPEEVFGDSSEQSNASSAHLKGSSAHLRGNSAHLMPKLQNTEMMIFTPAQAASWPVRNRGGRAAQG